MEDAGTQAHTSDKFAASLLSTVEDADLHPARETPPPDWLDPLPTTGDTHRRRHIAVSQDHRYHDLGLSADDGDAECTTVPRCLLDWVLPLEEIQGLFQTEHGTAPGLIYA